MTQVCSWAFEQG